MLTKANHRDAFSLASSTLFTGLAWYHRECFLWLRKPEAGNSYVLYKNAKTLTGRSCKSFEEWLANSWICWLIHDRQGMSHQELNDYVDWHIMQRMPSGMLRMSHQHLNMLIDTECKECPTDCCLTIIVQRMPNKLLCKNDWAGHYVVMLLNNVQCLSGAEEIVVKWNFWFKNHCGNNVLFDCLFDLGFGLVWGFCMWVCVCNIQHTCIWYPCFFFFFFTKGGGETVVNSFSSALFPQHVNMFLTI